MTPSPVADIKLRLAPAVRRDEVIKKLEWLLQLAKDGKLESVAGIYEYVGCEGYSTFGTSSESRLKTAGALLDAAVSRLGYGIADDN